MDKATALFRVSLAMEELQRTRMRSGGGNGTSVVTTICRMRRRV
jgi:hypothetical protein